MNKTHNKKCPEVGKHKNNPNKGKMAEHKTRRKTLNPRQNIPTPTVQKSTMLQHETKTAQRLNTQGNEVTRDR